MGYVMSSGNRCSSSFKSSKVCWLFYLGIVLCILKWDTTHGAIVFANVAFSSPAEDEKCCLSMGTGHGDFPQTGYITFLQNSEININSEL